MIDADKVIARLRAKEAEHRRTNRLPYADEYGETADLIEDQHALITDLRDYFDKECRYGQAAIELAILIELRDKCNAAINQKTPE